MLEVVLQDELLFWPVILYATSFVWLFDPSPLNLIQLILSISIIAFLVDPNANFVKYALLL